MKMNLSDSPFQIKLSFEQLVEALKGKRASGQLSDFEDELLQDIDLFPELCEGINNQEQVEKCKDVLDRLLKDLFPSILSLNEIKAINIPYTDLFFNSSKRFQNILNAAGPAFELKIRNFDEHQFYVMSCCIILNERYGTKLNFGQPLFYDIPDKNGNNKHYRILYNADFLDIVPTAASKKLTPADVELLLDNYNDIDLWKFMFPKESYILKGFAIITLFDATIENAVSVYKESFLGSNSIDFIKNTETILKTIYQTQHIRCGFMFYNQDSGKLTGITCGAEIMSLLLPHQSEQNAADILSPDAYEMLFNKKQYYTISDLAKSKDKANGKLLSVYAKEGARSLLLATVEKKDQILGVLEIISTDKDLLNSINGQKLEIFMSYFSESIDRLIVENENNIQAIIQRNYTTIHDSVNWRFREEVEKSIHFKNGDTDYKLEEIIFENVYPLYGQVDIENSSVVRNNSIQKDLQHQLGASIKILKKVGTVHPDDYTEDLLIQAKEFKNDLVKVLRADVEQQITHFLNRHIHSHLKAITNERLFTEVTQYFEDNREEDGLFYSHRRSYAQTISSINNNLSRIIDGRQEEAQNIIPHYYERFKTDGVDHNLYVGAAIAPKNDFTVSHLNGLRFWQLQTLCEMIAKHQQAGSEMGVTGLILVYSAPLTIRFRMDEKRFDVDGAYNVRFEVIKKRIDKAHIKGSAERIVKRNHIAIVYAAKEEELEYMQYIGRLQSLNLVHSKIEKFDVEDLQSVFGLKGIRIAVMS